MKYISSCSFGKDSLATIILAKERGDPLDEVVYCEVPLQVYVDLEKYKIERELDGKPLDSWQYDTLVELIETELEGMDFQTLVSVSDEDIEKALALEGGDFR